MRARVGSKSSAWRLHVQQGIWLWAYRLFAVALSVCLSVCFTSALPHVPAPPPPARTRHWLLFLSLPLSAAWKPARNSGSASDG